MRFRLQWGILVLGLIALALRLPGLAWRPMHTDESVHALKFRDVLEKGFYRYDSNEFHGPSLYYATWPLARLAGHSDFAGTNENTYRRVPALFGVGLVLMVWLLRDLLGRGAAWWAGLLTALSPAMVFYSRYYIHEMLLVFFTMALLVSLWRYRRQPGWGWALLAGASVALMHTTKETFVLNLAAMLLATGAVMAWARWIDHRPLNLRRLWSPGHWGLALLLGVIVSVTLFSSFFTHASGPLDSIRTYLPWGDRAGGKSPHTHPWHYYLSLLLFTHRSRGPVWSEVLIVALAVVGFIAGLFPKASGLAAPRGIQWLGFYTLFLTGAYSVIAYKTPWCLLGFLHGLILLAGVGAMVLIRWRPQPAWRGVTTAILLAAAGQLAWQSYRTSFVYYVDQRNPYVYAHTASNLLVLVKRLENLAQVHPEGRNLEIKVAMPGQDYWPLPWYLRRFTRVGYYGAIPPDVHAALWICSPRFTALIEQALHETHLAVGIFALRPGAFLQVVVDKTLWSNYLKSGPQDEDE